MGREKLTKVLIANVGSTSYKYQLYESKTKEFLVDGKIERIGSSKAHLDHCGLLGKSVSKELGVINYAEAIKLSLEMLVDTDFGVLKELHELAAVGFKAVHAGAITGAVLVDEAVIRAMEEYEPVVPAHNGPYLEAIRLFQLLVPEIPLVTVFETWFHQTIPDYAAVYSIPRNWTEIWGIRKYGFHGASHRFIAERVADKWWSGEMGLKLISCHLGGSSSVCAINDGKSVDTSMGFSAQAGLPMSNRVGDLDPFVIFHLLQKTSLSLQEIQDELVHNSGLKGISGLSGDLRDLEEAADDPWARLAIESFEYKLKLYIGAYAATLNGVNVIAFTGGIGEHDSRLREEVLFGLEYLGIKLDKARNRNVAGETVISSDDSRVLVLVIPAGEGQIVGRETAKLIEIIGLPSANIH